MPSAAVVHQFDQPIKIEEVTYRPLRVGEVMVRLAACGVCHSDLSALNELYPCPLPVILGHEAAGRVVELGPGVSRVAVGDHVVGMWRPSCGECRYCRSGKSHLCKLGDDPTKAAEGRIFIGSAPDRVPVHEFLGVGGFSEYTILSENALVRIDPAMPLEKAALLGCAVITGYGAAQNTAGVKDGDEVAVFGCGGVGLNIIQGSRDAGARTIIAIDLDEAKLDLARKFGATHVLRGDSPELAKQVRALTEERQGVDYAFDAVGSVKIDAAAHAITCRGGAAILVGIAHMREKAEFPQMMTVMQEKQIRGCMAGSAEVTSSIQRLVARYLSGELNLDELVTRTYPLSGINEAMDDLRAGKNARGVLVF